MIFLFLFPWCYYFSCCFACQSHSNCDPLPLPPTSRSFDYELSGCKCVRICPFAHYLAIATCPIACCAFIMNMRFTPWYPNGCAHQPIWNFLWKVFLALLIVVVVQVASNWTFACWLVIHSTTCCVVTIAFAIFWLYFPPSPFAWLYYAFLLLFAFSFQDFQIFNRSHYMWFKVIH